MSTRTTDFLNGGGDLGERIRTFDWASTALGAPAGWPQNLKLAVGIMLASSQPIWIGWGPELLYLYNDAYKSIIGGKHPWALGRPTAEVWREIWPEIGPMLATAMGGRRGTYVESQLLIMERHGYPEETYYTFSYSPIPNEDGTAGGIICANSDDTRRVIGERQMALLRDLAAGTADARTPREVCERSARVLARDGRDLPFATIYLPDADGRTLSLAGATGIAAGHPAAPATLAVDATAPWPIENVLRTQELQIVADLDGLFGALPPGPWDRAPTQAAILPVASPADPARAALLVVALNPCRLFDDDYRSFLTLLAGQIAAAIATAQAREEERRRVETLAELDRAKTAFFSNVSHEFRTPLTLMLGPIEDALNDTVAPLAPPQRERVEVAHRNALRLLKLVNALLDFSRIEAGRVEARFEPTDLAQFTAALASNFESAAARAGLAMEIRCAPLSRPVHVDRDMWEKVVLNLLSNALKFTFEGGISVDLAESADGTAAELVVRDTGVGVPPHEVPRLFERFHRIQGQRSRSFEGSGIGLALVQELVRQHGGTIRAESREGEGTSFTVSLPFGTAHLPRDQVAGGRERAATSLRAGAFVQEALRWLPEPAGGDAGDTRWVHEPEALLLPQDEHVRILVADDNADMRDYIRRLLGGRWEVETVNDGRAALDAVRTRRPDLVLADVMMPRLDGFGLLQAIRDDPALRDLPVIMLSARAGEEARVEGLDAGADDYLTKPFSARELVARINANLKLARVRRDATQGLRESEARFRNMADHAPVMMWVTDGDGRCTYLNRGWYDFTGEPPADPPVRGWLHAAHHEDAPAAQEALAQAIAGRAPFHTEYRLRRADGAYRWVIDTAMPRFAEDGAFLGHIGSVIDIADRKAAEALLERANSELEERVAVAMAQRADAEAQLRQAQKMEAIGKLTGGVAHDFNNVLQVIGGNLQLLARDVAGDLRALTRVQTALGGVMRGSKLASQLLAFGRRQALAPRVVNLGRLLRAIDDMLRRALGEEINIETAIQGGLWNTFVDPAQVENALLNLAINARDAMEGRGRLTIEAGNAFLDDSYAARHAEVTAGQYVMLAVSDTGHGIPADIIDQVFEPFFTTKPEGRGTGLGLSMVYGFVKQSGGHVKLYSEPGQGTTVRIYLPRARAAEDIETDVETGPATGGTETVLVVEDDEDVRATVVELIAELGYRVLKARDAHSALAIVESGVPIDLLFTDVVMPGPLRSPELARKARERLPEIAVLFTSGYTENAIVHGGRLDEGVDLLSKPYTREALARKLRHALRNREQRAAAAEPPPPIAAPAVPARGPAPAVTRALKVLLVEDDVLIRMVTNDMLVDLGHTVTEAADADQALAALGTQRFDLLLTDVGLPGRSGTALAEEVALRWPETGLVFASGYDLAGTLAPDLLGRSRTLRKPYSAADLAAVLRSFTGG